MTEAFPAVTVPGWLLSPAATQSARRLEACLQTQANHDAACGTDCPRDPPGRAPLVRRSAYLAAAFSYTR